MMKRVYLFLVLVIACWGCQDMKVGYLRADNAGYLPNELEVIKTLDPVEDGVRIANEAPWVTPKIQGVLGTSPLLFEFVSVKVSDGGDAEIFKKEITVRGGGVMELPLHTVLPKGRYVVTLKVSNDGYSELLSDIYTFVVK